MKSTINLVGNIAQRAVYIDGKKLDPAKSLQVVNHSPDGFAWGYGGSGPAQLALAILLEFMSEDFARQNYQKFKNEFVAKLPQRDFDMQIPDIYELIERTTRL